MKEVSVGHEPLGRGSPAFVRIIVKRGRPHLGRQVAPTFHFAQAFAVAVS